MASRCASTGAFVMTSIMLLGTIVACTSTARITDIYMSLDADGSRKRSVFVTDSKEIHCIVEMGIGRKGSTVEAIVRQTQSYDFMADKFFETDRIQANVENAPAPQEGIQTLDLDLKPSGPMGDDAAGQPFAPGRFQCEARLDGELQKIVVFNIDFPDCPTAAIKPATLCFGFYKKDTVCPKYGNTSRDKATCTCSVDKGWECEE